MGLMSTLAFLEASDANSSAQDAAREVREHREFIENKQNKAYYEETKNLTKKLFQDLYNNNCDVEKCDLTYIDRIKKPMESRVQNAMKAYDWLAQKNSYLPTKSKVIITLALTVSLITFLSLFKGFNLIIFIIFLISLFFSLAGLSAYRGVLADNRNDKNNKSKREERQKRLENLALEFPNLLAGGIIRKSYLDSVIYDVVEALIKNGDKERVEEAYKTLFSLLGDFNQNSVYFNNRFREIFGFTKVTFSEYNNLIEQQ